MVIRFLRCPLEHLQRHSQKHIRIRKIIKLKIKATFQRARHLLPRNAVWVAEILHKTHAIMAVLLFCMNPILCYSTEIHPHSFFLVTAMSRPGRGGGCVRFVGESRSRRKKNYLLRVCQRMLYIKYDHKSSRNIAVQLGKTRLYML